jgi:transcriptional regulator with XRE-family HTH domain
MIMENRSSEEWLTALGEMFRRLRVEARLTQDELASTTQLSLGAIKGLENGSGSTLHTVVAVARALGQESWLAALAPPVQISPLAMLKASGREGAPRRVRKPAPTKISKAP